MVDLLNVINSGEFQFIAQVAAAVGVAILYLITPDIR